MAEKRLWFLSFPYVHNGWYGALFGFPHPLYPYDPCVHWHYFSDQPLPVSPLTTTPPLSALTAMAPPTDLHATPSLCQPSPLHFPPLKNSSLGKCTVGSLNCPEPSYVHLYLPVAPLLLDCLILTRSSLTCLVLTLPGLVQTALTQPNLTRSSLTCLVLTLPGLVQTALTQPNPPHSDSPQPVSAHHTPACSQPACASLHSSCLACSSLPFGILSSSLPAYTDSLCSHLVCNYLPHSGCCFSSCGPESRLYCGLFFTCHTRLFLIAFVSFFKEDRIMGGV